MNTNPWLALSSCHLHKIADSVTYCLPMRFDEMLTTEELAELLHKTPAAVRQMRHLGTAPRGVRIGKRVLYPESEVQEWLERRLEDDRANSS